MKDRVKGNEEVQIISEEILPDGYACEHCVYSSSDSIECCRPDGCGLEDRKEYYSKKNVI